MLRKILFIARVSRNSSLFIKYLTGFQRESYAPLSIIWCWSKGFRIYLWVEYKDYLRCNLLYYDRYADSTTDDYRADSRFVPSQWEMVLLCNYVSHWLGAILESALGYLNHIVIPGYHVVSLHSRTILLKIIFFIQNSKKIFRSWGQ